jgi:hypothetical protein
MAYAMTGTRRYDRSTFSRSRTNGQISGYAVVTIPRAAHGPKKDTVGGLSRCSVRSCWHQKCLTARPAVMRLKNHTNGVPWVRLSGGLSHQTVEAGSSRLSVHSFGFAHTLCGLKCPNHLEFTPNHSDKIYRTARY